MICIHDNSVDCDDYWQDCSCPFEECPVYIELMKELYGE